LKAEDPAGSNGLGEGRGGIEEPLLHAREASLRQEVKNLQRRRSAGGIKKISLAALTMTADVWNPRLGEWLGAEGKRRNEQRRHDKGGICPAGIFNRMPGAPEEERGRAAERE